MVVEKFKLYDYYLQLREMNIVLSYKGPFTPNIMKEFADSLKNYFRSNPVAAKKIFGIFIELAVNISSYSAETNYRPSATSDSSEYGIGTIVIGESDTGYMFVTGNIVRNESVALIRDKCEKINAMTREELREYKIQKLAEPPGKRGNAHIGLIKIALMSGQNIDLQINAIDSEYSFLAVSIDVDKL